MSTDAPPATREPRIVRRLVDEALRAWNAHDLDAILAQYADDAVYDQHDGSTPSSGRTAIRARYEKLFESMRELRFHTLATHVGPAHWVSRFTVDAQVEEGSIAYEIVDVVALRDGLIVRKDCYLSPPRPREAHTVRFLNRFRGVFRQPGAEAVTDLYSDTGTLIHPGLPEPIVGREALLGYWRAVFAALPNLRLEVLSHAARGNTLFLQFEASATRAGHPVRWRGVDVFQLHGERAATGISYFDPSVFITGEASR